MVDHQVLNRDQGDEQHEPDDVIAAHHKLPEGANHVPGGGGSLISVQQNAPAARQSQRQAEQGQQRRREGNTENCTGRVMYIATKSTRTEAVRLADKRMSSAKGRQWDQHHEHQRHGD